MQFRTGNARPSPGIGCGGLVALLGLTLVSPVGEWLIKVIGWILIVVGIFLVVSGIYFWMKGSSRGGRL